MPAELLPLAVQELREQLLKVGFTAETLREDEFQVGGQKVALAGFSHRPFDTRTSCVAAISAAGDASPQVAALRPLGAPLIYVHNSGQWEVWFQGTEAPELFWSRQRGSLAKFIREHRRQIDPRSIFRAKTIWRAEKPEQMTFVDVGFLQLVEQNAGIELCQLVEKMLHSTREALCWDKLSEREEEDAQWLVKANFWLLAARILHDKKVDRFKRLDLENLDDVFRRVTTHYGVPIAEQTPAKRRKALGGAVEALQHFPSLELISTEALAFVYENALITKDTRRQLGTHSTPGWLVEYVLARLTPWIEEMPGERRFVYEPACGHAPFLLGAMRLLAGLPHCGGMDDTERHRYLKDRLRGGEIDDFAREVARLSLTLADIPNHNGWHLDSVDMFDGDQLERRVAVADIILANPPFEKGPARTGVGNSVAYVSKAAELFRRTTQAARPGTCFGFILPQSTLDTKKLVSIREQIAVDCEWIEVCSLPDRVFAKAGAESAVLIGIKRETKRKPRDAVRCRSVGLGDEVRFAETGRATTEQIVPAQRFALPPQYSFFVPPLSEIWDLMNDHETVDTVATVGQGFFFRSENDPERPSDQEAVTEKPDAQHFAGFINFAGAGFSHELPKIVGIANDIRFVDRTVAGWVMGKPQIVMNYAPVRRGPWQVTAFLDARGHRARDRFLVLRPRSNSLSLQVLWAILNSPFATAFLGTHSSKREILCGTVRRLPFPAVDSKGFATLEACVEAYFTAAKAFTSKKRNRSVPKRELQRAVGDDDSQPLFSEFDGSESTSGNADTELDRLRLLHWRMDAEVLRLYDLNPEHERALLDFFHGAPRVGVPFSQTQYCPRSFASACTLRDFIAITEDWPKLEVEHEKLVDLEYVGKLTSNQAARLDELQRLADLQADLVAPWPVENAEAEMQRLKGTGKWIEE